MSDQYLKVCDTLKRLRNEVQSVLANWALFENANGYPTGNRRDKLRQSMNENYESNVFARIRNLIERDTILTLHRMIDHADSGKKSNVQSLARVKQFLDQKDCIELLVSKARKWNAGLGLEAYNEKLVRSLFKEVLPRLRENKGGSIRNVGVIREKITNLRNSELAHSLEGKTTDLPRLFDVRDGVVLTTILVKKCSLLIEGFDWDPKYIWQESLKNAQQFWDRFQEGFDN